MITINPQKLVRNANTSGEFIYTSDVATKLIEIMKNG